MGHGLLTALRLFLTTEERELLRCNLLEYYKKVEGKITKKLKSICILATNMHYIFITNLVLK